MGLKDLSNCCKGCIACGVCSAVVAAIMIPVGILVIAPNMGQNALNVATMNIPESRVFDIPDNLHDANVAQMFNSVQLDQTSLPLYAKLHECDLVMNIPGAPTDPNDPASWMSYERTNLAWFRMPEQGVKHGENDFTFSVPVTVLQPDAMVQWTFSLALGGFPNGTDVYIVGRPKMTALGMITMELKLGKKMHCVYVPPTTTTTMAGPTTTTTAGPITTTMAPSMSSTTVAQATTSTTTAPSNAEEMAMSITARRLAGVGVGPVTLSCTDQGEMADEDIDAVLANFTRDRGVGPWNETATTTTAAPAVV